MAQLKADSSQLTADSNEPSALVMKQPVNVPLRPRAVVGWVGELSAVSCRLSARKIVR